MDASRDAARSRFDRWAARYERDRRSRRNLAPRAEALPALGLGAGDRLLDVGCGSGAAVRAAAPLVARAVGVDLSAPMVARARSLARGVERAEFVVGASDALPFPDAAFSALLCSSSFHHYRSPARALAEMARVLAPGGRMAIAEPSADLLAVRVADLVLRRVDRGHVRLYRGAELAALARGAGLEQIEVARAHSPGYQLLRARRAETP